MKHGFYNLVVISSHGGNFAFLESIAQDLSDLPIIHNFVARLFVFTDLDGMIRTQHDIARKFNIPLEEAGWHADVLETACMQVIRPDLVHMDYACPGWLGDSKTVWDQIYNEGMKSVSPTGIIGDPRRATRELGKLLLDTLSDWMSGQIRNLLN
jgi:creatinine amidohydrolase